MKESLKKDLRGRPIHIGDTVITRSRQSRYNSALVITRVIAPEPPKMIRTEKGLKDPKDVVVITDLEVGTNPREPYIGIPKNIA